MSLDSLLDGTLDDLADLPEFKPFPAGAHKCLIDFIAGKDAKKPSFQVKLTAVETLEVDDGVDPLVKGAQTSIFISFLKKDGERNEFAEGVFKKIMSDLKEATGGTSNREIIESSKKMEYAVVVKVKKGKDANGNETEGNVIEKIIAA